tara:strand:- start:2269 stop:2721 length:453 start_codon:yes stop_codon:yes gene_type:complete
MHKERNKSMNNLDRPIDDLELSVRVMSSLKYAEIKTVRDITKKTELEILRLPNIGRKSLNEIREVLSAMDLCFNDGETYPDKEHEKEDPYKDLKYKVIQSSEEAFDKTYESIRKMRQKDKVSYNEVQEVFTQHKKVSEVFEQSLKNLFIN